MVVESVKNETSFPPFLEEKGVPVCLGAWGSSEGKFGPLHIIVQEGHVQQYQRHHFLMCTEELSAPQAR